VREVWPEGDVIAVRDGDRVPVPKRHGAEDEEDDAPREATRD
jgi:hypothetical protein